MEKINNTEAFDLLNMLYSDVVRLNNKSEYFLCFDDSSKQKLYYGTSDLTDGSNLRWIANGKSHIEYLKYDGAFVIRNKFSNDIIYSIDNVSSADKRNIYNDNYTVLTIRKLDATLDILIVTNRGRDCELVCNVSNANNCKWDYRRHSSTHIIIENSKGELLDSDDIVREFYKKRKRKHAS